MPLFAFFFSKTKYFFPQRKIYVHINIIVGFFALCHNTTNILFR